MLHPLPYQNSYQPSILGNLPSATPPCSSCEGLFRVPSQVHPPLLIHPLAKLSNRLKEEFDLC